MELRDLTDFITQGNARSVAEALDRIYDSGSSAVDDIFISLITLDAQQINSALNQMQPALYKSMIVAQQSSAIQVRNTASNRMQGLLSSSKCFSSIDHFQNWITLLGEAMNQNPTTYSSSPQVGYHAQTGGIIGGLDYRFADKVILGVLTGYTASTVNWKNNQGKGNISTGYAGLYGSVIGNTFYCNASLIGGWSSYDAHRAIVYTGVNTTAYNNHDGDQGIAHIDAGSRIDMGICVLRPFESFDYIVTRESGFTETGAGSFNLNLQSSTSQMARNELGLNMGRCFSKSKGIWSVEGKLSWIYEGRFSGSSYVSQFAGTGFNFKTTGYFPHRNLAGVGLMMNGLTLNDRIRVSAYYNGEFSRNYVDNVLGVQLGLRF